MRLDNATHADADDPAVTAIPLSGVSVIAKDRTERVDRRLPKIRLRPRRTHHERQLQCESVTGHGDGLATWSRIASLNAGGDSNNPTAAPPA
jgi:hypothetical protein